MKELISFYEARQAVLEAVPRLGAERVPLQDALDRTLAEDVESRENIPPFDNSAMDGYAVRAEELAERGDELDLIGEVAAGSQQDTEVRPGTCVRIMTGAPLPAGANAVVPIEVATEVDGRVRFDAVPAPGDHVRRAGEDLRPGDKVIAAGHVVTPPDIGVMASLGFARVSVSVRPRIAVVTTGSELVDVSAAPGPGQIRDSNGPALAAQVRTTGAALAGLWRARDDRGAIRACLQEAAESDVMLVSGGVSVGAYDLVKDELAAMGLELIFWRVRQKPGKPLAFGRLGETIVFGLPGNPVSSAVCFEEYVRPAVARMLGRSVVVPPLIRGRLASEIQKRAGLYYFARGIGSWSDGILQIEPAGPQGSHVASSLVRANGLVHLPEDLDAAPAGTEVAFEWFGW